MAAIESKIGNGSTTLTTGSKIQNSLALLVDARAGHVVIKIGHV